ncbi:MAG: HAD-IA family hydrolase [Rhodocyclaceae bacterium]
MHDDLAALDGQVLAVSFDVFDTALVRCVEQPVDIFHLLAAEFGIRGTHAFVAERVRAEAEARRVGWEASRHQEVGLEEIYAQLSIELPPGVLKSHLAAHERTLELRLSRPRMRVRRLYDHARRCGHRVGFVSDMYLDAELIANMLRQAGYEQIDFLLVSSVHGQTKSAGGLYQKLLTELNLAPSQILHVGDNHQSDILKAQNAGLRTLYMPKVTETLGKSALGKRFQRARVTPAHRRKDEAATIWSSLWRGLVAARSDLPIPDSHGFSLGYSHVGPLLLGFVGWLDKQASADRASHLYFLARDGHVMHRVHRMLVDHGAADCEGSYLHASRRGFNIPAMAQLDQPTMDFLIGGTSVLAAQEFVARTGLDPEEHRSAFNAAALQPSERIDSGERYERLRQLFRILEPALLAHAATEREQLRDYLAEQGVFDQPRPGLVDIGWHGTLQESMERLMHRFGVNADITGYYLGTFPAAGRRVQAGARQRAYLCECGSPKSMHDLILTSVEVFEWFFCAPHGSVSAFKRTAQGVTPIFDDTAPEQRRHDSASQMQEGALQFVADFLSALAPGAAPPLPGPELVTALIRELLLRPTYAEACWIGDIPHAEGFGGTGSVRAIAAPPPHPWWPSNWLATWHGLRTSFWPRGYLRRVLPAFRP